jgi:hypothetical protein
MYRFLVQDERGAVTVDWVALTAGIALLGIAVVYAVMLDSADYLIDEFDAFNQQYGNDADQMVSSLQRVNIGQ